MTDYRVYPDTVKTPLVLTADDGTPYVVEEHYDDEGHVTFHLYRFDDRQLADIYIADGLESDVDDEVARRKRHAKARRAEVPADEEVAVLRVIEYRGPRSWVEETVKRSLHGTRLLEVGYGFETVDSAHGPVERPRQQKATITGVTINTFPRRV
jgi:hypothetical protein